MAPIPSALPSHLQHDDTTYASPSPKMPPPTTTTTHAHPPPSTNDPAPQNHLEWTTELEERLLYVQRQLRMAQARWSEEQELWIDEVSLWQFFLGEGRSGAEGKEKGRELLLARYALPSQCHGYHPQLSPLSPRNLLSLPLPLAPSLSSSSPPIPSTNPPFFPKQVHHLEDRKRKCQKAEKKAKGVAHRVAKIWKAKTWGGSSSMAPMKDGRRENSAAAAVGDEGMGEGEEDADLDDGVGNDEDGEPPSTSNTTKTSSSLTTLFRTISLTNNKGRNTLDNLNNDLASSLPGTSEESNGKGKRKGSFLMMRRGSGSGA
ncbi:MAG: hypothetical protein Q9169_004984 [Polycauliona sp. 2 TL-2023]